MMWRLNFLVTVTCIVLQNHYMLYYICPMHTLFTIFVYAALALGLQVQRAHLRHPDQVRAAQTRRLHASP